MKMLHENWKDLPVKHHCHGEEYEYFRRSFVPRSAGHESLVCIYEVPPGKAPYPYHFHLKDEETFFIIGGQGTLRTPEGERTVKAGEFLFFPPTERGAHKLINTSETENDLMIIAAGYDHSRIIDMANSKKSAEKVLLFGFPALSTSMFQENIIRAHKAESSVKGTFRNIDSNIFAPAYDPFVTAQSIMEFIDNKRAILRKKLESKTADFSNIYLAPLSTKPHAIGMALYYLWEKGWSKNITMLYPMCGKYHLDCSDGIARIWRYSIQFPIKEI